VHILGLTTASLMVNLPGMVSVFLDLGQEMFFLGPGKVTFRFPLIFQIIRGQMDRVLKLIADTPLFNGLAEADLAQVRAIAVDRFYGRGETIFLEGDPGEGFYIVAAGKVKIFKVSLEGKEQILHIYGPGNPFGEVPVFSGDNFPANAVTLAKSHLLFFSRSGFARLITANPSLSMNMLAVLSMRLREFTVQIENLSLKEVPGRLASYLLYLAEEQAAETAAGQSGQLPEQIHLPEQILLPEQIHLPISKGQLASLLGTIPETLSRILAKLSGQEMIQVKGNQIEIKDRGLLEELAVTGKILE
jgi:CRP/FNR family transcriptional regulator